MRFVEIAIRTNVQSTFHYHVPPELENTLQLGHLVRVEFGTAMQPGIVLAFTREPEFKTKPVLELLDPFPVMTHEHIALARWMSATYLTPIGDCLWLMLPPGLTGKSTRRIMLRQPDFSPADPAETAVLEQLRPTGTKTQRQLETVLGAKNLRKPLESLVQQGVIKVEAVLSPPTVKPKTTRTVQAVVPTGSLPRLTSKLQMVWNFLRRHAYPMDVADVYASIPATIGMLNSLVKRGLAVFGERLVWRDSLADRDFIPSHPLTLTEEQQQVWEVIRGALVKNNLTNLTPSPSPSTERGIPADAATSFSKVSLSANSMLHSAKEDIYTTDSSSLKSEEGMSTDVASSFPKPANPMIHAAKEDIYTTDSPSLKSEEGIPADAASSFPKPANPMIHAAKEDIYTTDSPSLKSERGEGGEVKERHWQVAPHLWQTLKTFARQNRHEPTPAENYLWRRLRNRQLGGYRFRRQHAIERFIVDFICAETRLIIEVDGDIHQYTPAEDAIRQEFLEALGFRVLRFTNEAVLEETDEVLVVIEAALQPHPASSELLLQGATFDKGGELPAESPLSVYGEGGGGEVKTSDEITIPHTAFLLHGVTGSGKTEIYLHAIAEVLAQERQAIFLVPEIALTPQTIRRVAERFPDQVAVVHGSLSLGERYDTWRRARNGEIQVIVGTRSAVFTPLPDIGLIILDEEHDPSYKHSPPFNPPYYHARAVAAKLMALNDGVLILGSATPAVETMQQTQRGELGYLHLSGRIMGHRQRIEAQAERSGVTTQYHALHDEAMTIELPPVHVVDMREELKEGNRSIFSRALFFTLRDVLERHEQAILFLNRRGQSSYVFCRDCGYVATCQRCDMPMTYHRAGELLHCHHCGNTQPAPTICPQCQSNRIRYFGAGTQQVEEELKKLFPLARSIRWDADTADKPDDHEAILAQFIAHEADVLIGTQMIAKGLDLPLVTLVGVVNADPGLALPDFRAGERAFQLLTQVAGRAGRGILGGRVILQTYQPLHDSIRLAAQHNYFDFFALEIERRRELGYPPFRRLARLLIQSTHPVNVQREAEAAAELLRQHIAKLGLPDDTLIGPAPCFFGRIDRNYRWQVLLRSTNPAQVLRDFPLRHGWWLDLDPLEVL